MPEILGRRERTRYALAMTRYSLKGGGTWFQYGPGETAVVPDTSTLLQRLRRAPHTFRSALAAINEEAALRQATGS